MNKKYQITILRPGGNNTALVNSKAKKLFKRKAINDLLLKAFPDVEQVGFIKSSTKYPKLTMAGGEFCGNATRSFAYLLLNGKKGMLTLKVSGTTQLLAAGSKKKGTAYAQMPIIKSLESVKKISKNLYQVTLEGIIHVIYNKPVNNLSNEKLKKLAKKILAEQNLLLGSPAAGVMFIEEKNQEIVLKPVVWVRDIQTLFFETACASGSTAVGLWLSIKNNKTVIKEKIKQPSGNYIFVSIKRTKKEFINATIDGPIEIVRKDTIYA